MTQRSIAHGRTEAVDHTSLIAGFVATARQSPQRTAVVESNRSWTYAQLLSRAESIARALSARGVGPDDRVATLLPRGFETLATFIGLLRLGATYVPLELEDPSSRRATVCRLASVELIVTNDAGAAQGVESVAPSDLVGDEDVALPPVSTVPSSSTAYIMFTSGTTGEPKGVAVSQFAVAVYAADRSICAIEPSDRVLHNALLSFDASIAEIWGALQAGASLVVQPVSRPSLDDIRKIIRHHEVTVAMIPTGLFHALTEAGLEDLAGLRWAVVGGDVLSGAHVRKLFAHASHPIVTNGYGPTEGCVLALGAVLRTGHDVREDRLPIGRPMDNTRAYVLDNHLQPVEPGQTGDLWLGGDSLADGYLDPQLTLARFVADPFFPGGRIYRSGDVASMDEHGVFWFHGRRDRMVKVHGVRVDLGEIESVLRSVEGVADCAVVRGPTGSLIAHVVGSVPEDRMRAHVADRLLDVLAPEHYVVHPNLPLSTTGKVDLATLEAWSLPSADTDLTPIERAVAAVWMDSLSVPTIGRDDSFFGLGGNSLSAARLVQQLAEAFDVRLSVGSIYRWPTLGQLATELERLGATAPEPV